MIDIIKDHMDRFTFYISLEVIVMNTFARVIIALITSNDKIGYNSSVPVSGGGNGATIASSQSPAIAIQIEVEVILSGIEYHDP